MYSRTLWLWLTVIMLSTKQLVWLGFFFNFCLQKYLFHFNELSRGGKRYELNKPAKTTFNSFNLKRKKSFLKVLMPIPEKRFALCVELNDGLGSGHMDWVNKLDPNGSIALKGKDKSAQALLFWLDRTGCLLRYTGMVKPSNLSLKYPVRIVHLHQQGITGLPRILYPACVSVAVLPSRGCSEAWYRSFKENCSSQVPDVLRWEEWKNEEKYVFTFKRLLCMCSWCGCCQRKQRSAPKV